MSEHDSRVGEEAQTLVARLRAEAQDGGPYHLCHDAADLLESLARRNAELERQLAAEIAERRGHADNVRTSNVVIDQLTRERDTEQEQARQALNDWHKAMDELAEMRGQLAQTQERSGDEQDPEWQEIPPLDPTKLPRCPKCRTYGHEHRKDCPYVGSGMNHHVYPARAARGEHG